MQTFWGIISLLLAIGFIGAVALIVYLVIGAFLSVRKATKQPDAEREKSRVEMESLNSEAIRSQLLNYSYFTASLRATPTLQNNYSSTTATVSLRYSKIPFQHATSHAPHRLASWLFSRRGMLLSPDKQ